MSSLMSRLDRVTRTFWRAKGRPVDLAPRLSMPCATSSGVLRTDHDLRLWSARVVRLHYRLDRTGVSEAVEHG